MNAVIFGTDGVRAAVVDHGKTALQPVTLGRDYGNSVEVIAGLTGDEQVIVNPSDSLEAGEPCTSREPRSTVNAPSRRRPSRRASAIVRER